MSSRPLSPHLQIYRPQLTSMLSIMHRGTGIFLGLGALALTYWLLALAGGESSYASAQSLFVSVPGLVLLGLWAFSFYYHLCNGIRHLFWDLGMGFELDAVYRSGYAVIAASVVLTALTMGYAFTSGGAA